MQKKNKNLRQLLAIGNGGGIIGERKENEMSIETVNLVCGRCAKVVTLDIDLDAYQMWKDGMCIQDAFPQLNADEREMIMTRTCGDCWDDLWDNEAEEEWAAGVFE